MNITKTLINNFQRFAITDGRMSGTAISAVIKGLEKQVPSPVKFEDVGYDQYHDVNVYSAICPSCGVHIIEYQDNIDCFEDDPEQIFKFDHVHHAYEGRNSYCDRCGQKLEWGMYK